MNERNLAAEVSRLRHDAEYARESQKEVEMLKSELNLMHERLRRTDPTGAHIYGQYTARLAQQQTQQQTQQQANAPSAPYALPPMNSAPPQHQSHQQHYPQMPPPGAMQGVEYGGAHRSSYDMR